ncbi:MurR/RpiR family transcriptional regulator [uncultured Selenomonas sp.]|uniref:MurR/RpiR family transcriptional regulator n=1 Tax=uncultured Selenomonas sp. TaxID=159275 RepID=UPI002803FEE9|nr:MurR/RpiR family transcriptional regulator [uncultured Selenomonas sp.]
MKNLVEQLQAKEGFSPSECILADFLLENFRLLAGMSTRQLAKETYTNSAAIVRFSQKLGFGGYTEFKVQFLAEMIERIRNPQVTDFSMTDRDTVQSLMDKVTGLEVEALRSTRGMLDAAQFMRALAMLSKAQHIDFYAMDENLNIAQMAASGFLMANKGATVHPAMTMQYLSAAGMQKGHVGFFISRTGENRMLIDIAHLLRLRSVPRLLITSAPSSTLASLADVTFPVATVDTMEKLGPRIFLLGAKYVTDLLFAVLMTRLDFSDTKKKEQWLNGHFHY